MCSGRPLLLALAVVAVTAAPAHAAGATVTLTNVGFDPATGPTDPACKATLPGLDGKGSASYEPADKSHIDTFQWAVPTTIGSGGAGARTQVTVQANQPSGYSASIALKPPLEFGTNADARQQITATVPVGQTGTASDSEDYTFTPSREFVADEKLYIRIEIGCANIVYEYTGSAAPSACATASAGERTTAVTAACREKEIATPKPGGVRRVTAPGALGKAETVRTTVTSSTGSLDGTTIVGEGERKVNAHGDNVAACWFLGPDAFDLDALDKSWDKGAVREAWEDAQEDPNTALIFCMLLAQDIAANEGNRDPNGRAAGNGCSAQRVVVRGRTRKGKLSLTRIKPPRGGVKYGCSAAANGALRLTTRGRLREQLGRKFDLGVLRRPDAPAQGGRLTFGFRMII